MANKQKPSRKPKRRDPLTVQGEWLDRYRAAKKRWLLAAISASAVIGLGAIITLPGGKIGLAAVLPGDINSDNKVDVTDLSILLANYGQTASQATNPAADINGNGVVDVTDLSALLSNYGKTNTSGTLISEDFSSPVSSFTPAGGTWAVSGGRYVLTAPVSQNQSADGLYNRSVHSATVSGDFTLNVDLAATATSSPWDDAAVILGYQNPENYYYAVLNEGNDQYTHGLFKIQNGVKTELADFSGSLAAGVLTAVRVEKSGLAIRVYQNGQLVGSASDATLPAGKVGFGSWDNEAWFDNLTVKAGAPTNPPSPSQPPTPSPSPSPSPNPGGWNCTGLIWCDEPASPVGKAAPLQNWADAPWNIYGGASVSVVADASRGKAIRTYGPGNTIDPAQGNQRAEIVPSANFSPGQTRWIGFDLYVAPNTPPSPSWQSAFQIKTGGPADRYGNVGLSVSEYNSNDLVVGDGASRMESHPIGPKPNGTWTRLVYGVFVSTTPGQGWVEIWRDGANVLPRDPWTTKNADGTMGSTMFPGGSNTNYLKFGLYHGPSPHNTDFRYARLKIGATRESVMQ